MELSLQNFRDEIGVKNRGYLKVDGETVVKQGNSALGSLFGVGKSGSAEQNREVRESFVKALSEAGANEAFLADVRMKLGLNPESPVSRTLLERKVAADILRDFDAQKVAMMPNLIDLTRGANLAQSPEALQNRQQAVRLLATFTKLPVGELDVLSNKTLVQLSEAVRVGGVTDGQKLKDYLRTIVDPKLSAEDAQKILSGIPEVDQNPEVERTTRYTSEAALAMVDHLESNPEKGDVVDMKEFHRTKEGFLIVNDTPKEVVARLDEVVTKIVDTKAEIAELTEDIASYTHEIEALKEEKAKVEAEWEQARALTDEAIEKMSFVDRLSASWKKTKLANGDYEKALQRIEASSEKATREIALSEGKKAELEKALPALEAQHESLLVGKNPVVNAEQKLVSKSFEQKVREFAADIFSSDETWEMDRTEKNPAKRLKALFTKNADLIAALLDLSDAEFKQMFSGPLQELMEVLVSGIRDQMPSLRLPGVDIKQSTAFKMGLPQLGDEPFEEIDKTIREEINAKSEAMSEQMKGLVKEALQGSVKDSLRKKATRLGDLKLKSLNDLVKGVVDVDHGYGEFMKDAMTQYFERVPMSIKRQMFAAAIRYTEYQKPIDQLNLDAKAMAKEETRRQMLTLGAMLKGAGPILQKMMQGLSEMPINAELKLALKDMKSNLAPIPEQMVKAHLLTIVENSNGKIKSIQVKTNLGAASVGQAFLCTMTCVNDQGQEEEKQVVVKILRPDVQTRAEAEKQIFFDVAKGGMKNTFRSQLEGIMAEMDLTKEADNVVEGQIYTGNPFNGIAAMKLNPLVKASPYIMVLEKAPGTTIERYLADTKATYQAIIDKTQVKDIDGNPLGVGLVKDESYIAQLRSRKEAFLQLKALRRSMEVKQKKMIDLSRKWVQEALFGSGLFHGDMHGGNIMIDPTTDPKADKGLTVIDFGNAHKLSKAQQESILLMVGSAAAQDTNRFLDGFRALLPPESRAAFDRKRAGEGTEEAPSLHAIVHEIFYKAETSSKDTGPRILACLQEIQKEGIELPGAINNFSQSQIRLQGVIDQANEQLEEIDNQMRQLARNISDGEGSVFDLFAGVDPEVATDLVELEIGQHVSNAAHQRRVNGEVLFATELPSTVQKKPVFSAQLQKFDDPAEMKKLQERSLQKLLSADMMTLQAILTSMHQYAEGRVEPVSTNLKLALSAFEQFSKQLRPKLHGEIEHLNRYAICSKVNQEEIDLIQKLERLNQEKDQVEATLTEHREILATLPPESPEIMRAYVVRDIEENEAQLAELLQTIEETQRRCDAVTQHKNELLANLQVLEKANQALPADQVDELHLEGLKTLAEDAVAAYYKAQRVVLEELRDNAQVYQKEIDANTSPDSFFDMMANMLEDNMWSTVWRLGRTGLKWKITGKV